jgi:hypothetical protein
LNLGLSVSQSNVSRIVVHKCISILL